MAENFEVLISGKLDMTTTRRNFEKQFNTLGKTVNTGTKAMSGFNSKILDAVGKFSLWAGMLLKMVSML